MTILLLLKNYRMDDFKIGDIVKCIKPVTRYGMHCITISNGSHYLVKDVDDGSKGNSQQMIQIVTDEGINEWFFSIRFVLVETLDSYFDPRIDYFAITRELSNT